MAAVSQKQRAAESHRYSLVSLEETFHRKEKLERWFEFNGGRSDRWLVPSARDLHHRSSLRCLTCWHFGQRWRWMALALHFSEWRGNGEALALILTVLLVTAAHSVLCLDDAEGSCCQCVWDTRRQGHTLVRLRSMSSWGKVLSLICVAIIFMDEGLSATKMLLVLCLFVTFWCGFITVNHAKSLFWFYLLFADVSLGKVGHQQEAFIRMNFLLSHIWTATLLWYLIFEFFIIFTSI